MYNRHGMDFIDGLLGFNNVVRATVSEHPEYDVWYYYIVLVPVSLLPWTGPCLYGLWRRRSIAMNTSSWHSGPWGRFCSTASWRRNTRHTRTSPTGPSYISALHDAGLARRRRPLCLAGSPHPGFLYGLLFASLTAFTGKTPFPVPSLLLLTVFLIIMAILTWLAWWQKAYLALPFFLVTATASLTSS